MTNLGRVVRGSAAQMMGRWSLRSATRRCTSSVQPLFLGNASSSGVTVRRNFMEAAHSSYFKSLPPPYGCHLLFEPVEEVKEEVKKEVLKKEEVEEDDDDDDDYVINPRLDLGSSCWLYSLADQKVLKLDENDPPFKGNRLQENFRDCRCLGSSHGWVLLVKPGDCSLFLVNPFSPNPPVIPLPPVESLPHIFSSVGRRPGAGHQHQYQFSMSNHMRPVSSEELMSGEVTLIQKFVLSSSPDQTRDCTIVIAGGGTLAFCRPGETAWTALDGTFSQNGYTDVVFSPDHTKTLYAVGRTGVEGWDLTDPSSPRRTFFKCFDSYYPPHVGRVSKTCHLEHYFVPCDGEGEGEGEGGVLMAARHIETNRGAAFPYLTLDFTLFRLHFSPHHMESIYVDDLGDGVLLLGSYSSSSLVSAGDFPELSPNSIYFVDDYSHPFHYAGHDMGVFSVNDGTVAPLFPPSQHPNKNRRGATWVIPTPP